MSAEPTARVRPTTITRDVLPGPGSSSCDDVPVSISKDIIKQLEGTVARARKGEGGGGLGLWSSSGRPAMRILVKTMIRAFVIIFVIIFDKSICHYFCSTIF